MKKKAGTHMIEDIAHEIVEKIQAAQINFVTEEDVRIACEHIFVDELAKYGIEYTANYEVQVKSGAIDALFNDLCIEYKKAGLLQRNFKHFVAEKAKYLPSLAERYHTQEEKIYGVLLDGLSIGFFRRTAEGRLISDGPYEISDAAMIRFIQIADATKHKALISENLLNDLGSQSTITQELVSALWKSLKGRQVTRTAMFFTEWSRLFGQVSNFGNDGKTIIKEAAGYGIQISTEECGEFVFTLHTVYAIYIKHIALMILESKRKARYETADAVYNGMSLLDISRMMESGSEFRNLGIMNFLEGDFFCWYIYEWNQDIERTLKKLIIEVLDHYESSTATLKPEVIKDLLKELYQGLMSKAMRHDLGEYYTPDWLAQYTIDKSGYKIGDRVLDPSCGSGTFLVLLINQTIRELKQTYSPQELTDYLTSHIYGIDLNPLAVITARTNYLIAVEPYLDEVEHLEIPIYLSDAIFSPQLEGDHYTYYIDTKDGRLNLRLPAKIFKQGLLGKVLDDVEYCVRMSSAAGGYTITENEALQKLNEWRNYNLSEGDLYDITSLYKDIHNLESKDWNSIWCRIIKNHFTSAMLKDFDIIIGNPPWLKWSALPPAYRETIKTFCREYGLFSSDKFYGGVESDVSTMVLYSAAEKWLKQNGTLAMLITRSVFKTESSEGFRRFQLPGNKNIKFKVQEVHDFTLIRPFRDAVNKPVLLLLKKGEEKTEYPLPWIVWEKQKGTSVNDSMPLITVLEKTYTVEKAAAPVGASGSPWLTVMPDELRTCQALARSEEDLKWYKARKGVCTDCNGLYYGTVLSGTKQSCIFRNDPSLGRKQLPQSEHKIEKKLIFPIARGKEISAFQWNYGGTYGIIPQDSMHAFSVEKMLKEFPDALEFLAQFKNILEDRASLKRYLPNDPFYTCWNVGNYTFAKYKVCWAEISGHFKSCILSAKDSNIVIPDHKIYFIPTDHKKEAEYLCAFLNAPAVEQFVLGYAETTQIGTHITDYIKIPKFDELNSNHLALADITVRVTEDRLSVEEGRIESDRLLTEILA